MSQSTKSSKTVLYNSVIQHFKFNGLVAYSIKSSNKLNSAKSLILETNPKNMISSKNSGKLQKTKMTKTTKSTQISDTFWV